jgi:hypothetical protein
VALVRQFIGTWKNEYEPDSFVIYKFKPFGKGLKATYKVATKEETLLEAKQLVGFDPNFETIINSTLIETGQVVLFSGKFIADDKVSLEVKDPNNPENILSRTEYEFQNEGRFTVTRIFGHTGGKPGNYYRIED